MVIPSRQQVILRHVRRYGLTLRPVLDQLFYGNLEGGCDSDLARLRERLLDGPPAAGVGRESQA